ncbi:hypothetical protein HYT56_01890 [Candidatus Woesearchaeota archaeon]|nr:hypothetical protein [Candidatus Woesearchaeota archaeon]
MKSKLISIIIVTMFFIILSLGVSAIPEILNIQGKLTAPNGTVYTGSYPFSFNLYDALTGGGSLWEENLTLTLSDNGTYDINLGNSIPLENLTFDRAYYLGIKVDQDSEMTPRINFTAVPYSFRSKFSENLNINLSSDSLNETGTIANGSGATVLDRPTGIYISGKYAYVASGTLAGSLSIFDISNPSNPIEVGYIQDDERGGTATSLDGAYDVFVSGKYAYVTASSDDALSIIDISNPNNPVEIGTLVNGSGASRLNDARGIYISGKYAYIISSTDDALSIIDISNPNSPVEIGTLVNGSGASALDGPDGIYVKENYLFIGTNDGLTIIDVSNPSTPTEVGYTFSTGSIMSVYVSGGYAYTLSSGANFNNLSIVNVSNTNSPSVTGSILISGGSSSGSIGPRLIQVSDKYAYAALNAIDALYIFDISDPTSPLQIGIIEDNNQGGIASGLNGISGVYISGKNAYVLSDAEDTFSIINIGGPDIPSANIGDLASSSIEVSDNVDIGNNLYVRNGINVGPGGIKSDGPFSILNNSLIVDYNGQVGIGVTSPQALLEISNSSAVSIPWINVTDGAGGQKFIINNDGFIGIGTSSPTHPLHVAGNVNLSGSTVNLGDSGVASSVFLYTGSSNTFTFDFRRGDTISSIYRIDGDTSDTEIGYGSGDSFNIRNGTVSSDPIVFSLNNAGTANFSSPTGLPLAIASNTTAILCDSTNEGGIIYSGKHYGCNGTEWNAFY